MTASETTALMASEAVSTTFVIVIPMPRVKGLIGVVEGFLGRKYLGLAFLCEQHGYNTSNVRPIVSSAMFVAAESADTLILRTKGTSDSINGDA